MDKTKITLVTVGHIPTELSTAKIKGWKSKLFEVHGEIEKYSLTRDSDGDDWQYTDAILKQELPNDYQGDFLIAIVNIPLELNWFSRRLGDNKVVFSLYEIKDILNYYNIPLENAVFRLLYAYTLLFKRMGGQISPNDERTNFTHDETRGCLFDMNSNKPDIIQSCDSPIICDDCVNRMRNEKVSDSCISYAKSEICKIQKPLFFRISSFVKNHPIWSLIISCLTAIVFGALGSAISTILLNLIRLA